MATGESLAALEQCSVTVLIRFSQRFSHLSAMFMHACLLHTVTFRLRSSVACLSGSNAHGRLRGAWLRNKGMLFTLLALSILASMRIRTRSRSHDVKCRADCQEMWFELEMEISLLFVRNVRRGSGLDLGWLCVQQHHRVERQTANFLARDTGTTGATCSHPGGQSAATICHWLTNCERTLHSSARLCLCLCIIVHCLRRCFCSCDCVIFCSEGSWTIRLLRAPADDDDDDGFDGFVPRSRLFDYIAFKLLAWRDGHLRACRLWLCTPNLWDELNLDRPVCLPCRCEWSHRLSLENCHLTDTSGKLINADQARLS
ncbi:cytoplasmic,Dynein heavy chain [Trichinella spiralis]|uniref:Cytoplasmic,Dynein heavy chain n=1 Tax=Trichinella spiralis TaxID=6334 RepID=A0ABR3KG37_TRISP